MLDKSILDFMGSMYSFPVGASLLKAGSSEPEDSWTRAARQAEANMRHATVLVQYAMMKQKWAEESKPTGWAAFKIWWKKYVF